MEKSSKTIETEPVRVEEIYSTRLDDYPIAIVCKNCHAHVVTRVSYESGFLTWLIATGCVLLGCWCGCCCLPFLFDGTKDVRHTCPNCNSVIGVYRKLF